MKKIIFNCSTNIQGGPVQNAANFILETQNDHEFEFYYFISPQIYSMISNSFKNKRNCFLIKKSPSKNLRWRKFIKNKENLIKPDLVFTMAGPSYVKFKNKHLMGCSNPYLLFANINDVRFGRSYTETLLRILRTIYQKYFIKKADFYIFQTEYSKEVFYKKYKFPKKNLFYVPNAIGFLNYNNRQIQTSSIPKVKTKIRVLCPFENYPHKGLHTLPIVDNILKRSGIKVEFQVTISLDDLNKRQFSTFKKIKNINFIGRQKYDEMIKTYAENDLVFLPSVLEVFSSVTIESLYFKKPLVLSDKKFNREIIDEYGIYCNPFSPQDCANKIIQGYKLVDNEEYLSNAKNFISEKYNFYEKRFQSIKKIFREII